MHKAVWSTVVSVLEYCIRYNA